MARATWSLNRGRPAVEIELVERGSSRTHTRRLLADTGAGPNTAPFALLLDEQDCLSFARRAGHLIRLSGAYAGDFRLYLVEFRIPQLNHAAMTTTVVGIARPPKGFDGIAAFRFLNRFSYGNFGHPSQFGLESSDGN